MKEEKIFRASYSVLMLWEKGDWQEAIKAYFKLPDRIITPQMEEGKRFHEKWEKEINETKSLPKDFNSKEKLKNPITELKIEALIQDWLNLVGVIDCYEEEKKLIREFKTGITDSQAHANKMQIPIYALLLFAKGKPVEKAIINHYNQYTKTADQSFVLINKETLKRAKNWIETLAGEMFDYLRINKIYNKIPKS